MSAAATPIADRSMSPLDVNSSQLVIAAPGQGDGFWAGAPSANPVRSPLYLAYRLRRPVNEGRGYANVVARSTGRRRPSRRSASMHRDDLGCASLERPALVQRPDGGWRLYISLSTPDSKHWWIDALDADTTPETWPTESPGHGVARR